MNIVSFGGGTNSTAMIIGMYLHKIPIDLILFADTGGEQPHTYEFKEIQALWENYPDLFERAIALEHGSAKTNVNVKGLGRDWSWESYYNEFMANKEFEEAQLTFDQLFPDSPGGCICGAPCGCYDG